VEVWRGAFAGGAKQDALTAALASAPEANAHKIDAAYELHFGRDASSSDIAIWSNLFAGGATYADLEVALSSSPEFARHVPNLIVLGYEAWLDRNPAAAEVQYWRAYFSSGGSVQTFTDTVAQAGGDIAPRIVQESYRDFFGREASAGEVSYWAGRIRDGYDPNELNSLLAGQEAAQVHLRAELAELYQRYVSHDPSADEYAFWIRDLQDRGDWNRVVDELASYPGAEADVLTAPGSQGAFLIYREAGEIGPSTTVIYGFDSASEQIAFGRDGGGYAGTEVDPFGSARLVQTLSGAYDTMIDDPELVFLKGVSLSALTAGDFIL
jgi:hypothetical protein